MLGSATAQHVGQPLAIPRMGSLLVSGCASANTGRIIHGAYSAVTTNHGRPVYRKSEPVGATDVFVYYWDDRDGARFCGWWFGPKVGGDEVWAYSGERTLQPPAGSWQVPYGGPIDTALLVRARWLPGDAGASAEELGGGAGVGAAAPGAQRGSWKPSAPRSGPWSTWGQAGCRPQRVSPTDLFGAQREARPPACGIQEGASAEPKLMRWSAEAAEERQDGEGRQQQQEREPQPIVPCVVKVPRTVADGLLGSGRGAKRLMEATGCSMEVPRPVPGKPEGALVGVRLSGNTKQRRLAAQALAEVLEGADAEDAAAGIEGAVVLPHGLEHDGRREWLAWRLTPLEQELGVGAELSRGAVRLRLASGAPLGGDVAERARVAAEAAAEEARALLELTVEVPSELGPEAGDFEAAVAPLAEQYGLLLRALEPRDGIVPLHVLGPPDPARGAAAILWARFVHGKATATVLQAPGRVQAMSRQMTADFERDLQDLEADCHVQVHQVETMLWIAGTEPKPVARARQVLQEMLLFYLPEDFAWHRGLEPSAVKQLRQSPELRRAAARPDCALVLECLGGEGTVWACGSCCSDVQRLLGVAAGAR